MLLFSDVLERSHVRRLGWLADPKGWFRRTVEALFVLVAITEITGLDNQLQT